MAQRQQTKKNMFLITGNPRSGTYYTAELLRHLGHRVNRESNMMRDAIGTVAWNELPNHKHYSPVIHQLRHPLKTISSPLHHEAFEDYYDMIPPPTSTHYIFKRMYCWYMYDKELVKARDWWFRIEDLDEEYPKLFEKLGLEVPKKLPELPKTLNTRRKWKGDDKLPAYKKLTWKDLEKTDEYLANKIRKAAKKYGY